MMPALKPKEMTELLVDWSNGDKSALDKLMPLVHEELRRLAHHYMSRERGGHTLQTTALVNEAYLRLVEQSGVHFENRAHFFGIAAHSMRQILVEYARGRAAAKRGGAQQRVALDELDETERIAHAQTSEVVALDEALKELEEFDERLGRVVELRFFGGLSVAEVAEVLGVHPNTVVRDWRIAKAWLRRWLNQGGPEA